MMVISKWSFPSYAFLYRKIRQPCWRKKPSWPFQLACAICGWLYQFLSRCGRECSCDGETEKGICHYCFLAFWYYLQVTVHLSITVQLIECQLPPKTNFSALAPAFNPSVNFLLHRLFFPEGQKDSSVRPKERIDILGPGGEMGITPLYNGWALNVKGNEDREAWPAFSHVTSICHTGQAEFQGLKDKLSAGLLQWKFFLHWDHWTVLHFVKSLSTPSFNIMSFS